MLKRPELFTTGYHLTHFLIPPEVETFVRTENWKALEDHFKFQTNKDGPLFKLLQTYHDFTSMDFIINLRDAANEWEEDGIWHDDGSRVFAFSLSLTETKIRGGRLGIRHKGEENFMSLPTPGWGGLILFLTGIYGFEHKVHRVEEGRRLVIAGWCS